VLHDLSQYAAITTANNKNLFRIWVRVEGEMCNHLLVGELVALGALDDVVENEDSAVVAGLEDEDVLVLGLLVM